MIELRLTEEQANIVSSACEFYARILMGQFQEIAYHCPRMPGSGNYDAITRAWLELRKMIYPELKGAGHSYGIGKFMTADKAYDVHQAIQLATVGKEPFSYYTLPECKVVDDTAIIMDPSAPSVTVPCKIGDTVWAIRNYRGTKHPQQGTVSELVITKDLRLLISVKNIGIGEWGKKIFRTYQEAEEAIQNQKTASKEVTE